MSEVTDLVLPLLQRIQADLSEVRRDLTETKRDLGGKIDSISLRMDAFEDYFTYTMGLTTRNQADIARLGEQVRKLEAKVNGKDRQP